MPTKAVTTTDNPSSVPSRHSRAFQLLLSASTISMLGSRVSTIAYPMLVLYMTGSPATAGFAVFAATAPSILVYIPAGALVDRWPPRRTMVFSESGRGVAIATIVGVLILHKLTVPLLIPLSIVAEILGVFSVLAEQRCVRSVVERRHLPSALIRMQARNHFVVLVGRPLGGLLFEMSHIFPFLGDAGTFALSATAILAIDKRRASVRSNAETRVGRISYSQMIADVKESVQWLRNDYYASAAIPLLSFTTIIFQALILLFLYEAQANHLSSATIGIVLAASGLGGVLGSTTALWRRVLKRHSRIRIQMYAWSMAFAVLCISDKQWQIPCIAVIMVFLGLTGAMSNIELHVHLNNQVEEDMLARVTSIHRLLSFAAGAIGPMLGGFLIENWGARVSIYVLFIMTFALAVISARSPAMRYQTISVPRRRDRGGDVGNGEDRELEDVLPYSVSRSRTRS